ncbi:hypothetical protein MMC13_006535 [Lambiella insularis]|nr:hypothetical protein [Lambiella insularis]
MSSGSAKEASQTTFAERTPSTATDPSSPRLPPTPRKHKDLLREVLHASRARSTEWPWEARLMHMGGAVALTAVAVPVAARNRGRRAGGAKRAGAGAETDSLAGRRLLDDGEGMAKRTSVAGTSVGTWEEKA